MNIPSATKTHICALCGYRFESSNLTCHVSCPLGAGCHVICCPNCGYQSPDENRMVIASALKGLWERHKNKQQENVS